MEKLRGFRLKNVSWGSGDIQIIHSLSCTIEAGERWGILGTSGSGKSTLLRLMAGLETPDSGEIYLDGKLLSAGGKIIVPPRKRGISMVFQDLALWPNLTAMENVLLGINPALGSNAGKSTRELALDSLSMCGISHLAGRYPADLSGGEQQRLALSRALATRPKYLFLDEPFSGLDIEIKYNIINSIKQLTRKNNITTVLVSHDPFEVFNLCKKVIVLQAGRIAESGNFRMLLAHSTSQLMRAFRQYLKTMESADYRNLNEY